MSKKMPQLTYTTKQIQSCEDCKYCQFPRSTDDNWGLCKCKAMKRKTIDVYVCGGETPKWCPLPIGYNS